MIESKFLSFAERKRVLTERGLIINDVNYFKNYLTKVDYYRLIRYAPMLEQATDKFVPNTTFEDLCSLYQFDKSLRDICFAGVDTIEIGIRARIISVFGEKYGAFGYLDSQNFQSRSAHRQFLSYVKDKLEQSLLEEIIDDHRRVRIHEIPIWLTLELCTLNMLGHFYENLLKEDRAFIARTFDAREFELLSWINGTVKLRNIVAHHGRLIGRNYDVQILWRFIDELTHKNIDQCSIYAILYAFQQLLLSISTQDLKEWNTQLIEMLKSTSVNIEYFNCSNEFVLKNLSQSM